MTAVLRQGNHMMPAGTVQNGFHKGFGILSYPDSEKNTYLAHFRDKEKT
jgi:hypothetical protein